MILVTVKLQFIWHLCCTDEFQTHKSDTLLFQIYNLTFTAAENIIARAKSQSTKSWMTRNSINGRRQLKSNRGRSEKVQET